VEVLAAVPVAVGVSVGSAAETSAVAEPIATGEEK
jgi:hypothetical protein